MTGNQTHLGTAGKLLGRGKALIALLALGLLTACSSASGSASSSQAASGAASQAESSSQASEADSSEAKADDASKASDSAGGDDELAAIQKAGKIVVAVEGTYAPYTYHGDDGSLTGFDIDMAKAIAKKLGVEAEFVEGDWDALLAGVDSGRFDTVINNVSITDERAAKYDFTTPYLYMGILVVVKDDNDSIKSVADFKGKKTANNITNAYATELEAEGATIVPISTAEEAANLVESGRADFTTYGPAVFNDYMKQHPDAKLKVAFQINDQIDKAGIPFRKGETRLVEAVNKALDELRADGTLSKLSEEYFGADYTKEP